MLASWRVTSKTLGLSKRNGSGFCCRLPPLQSHVNGDQINNNSNHNDGKKKQKKKIVIVGYGWAGLGAAHHLCKQGFDVAILDGGNGFGSPDDVCMRVFSATIGGQVNSTPNGCRELFKQFGCSERLYRDVIGPLLQVGLFALAEQCSAAESLGILSYITLHTSIVYKGGILKVLNLAGIDLLSVKQKIFLPLSFAKCHGPFENRAILNALHAKQLKKSYKEEKKHAH